MSKEWFLFQEKIKDHFLSIGADATTNFRVDGVRTHHEIDVYVKTKYLGQNQTWLIEAKHWKTKVTKSHVLALRTIVGEVGADRGFIISLKGFQKGAQEAANNTSITLKTFDELVDSTKEFVESEILKTYRDRLSIIEDRYWSHSKRTRIDYGLRHDILDQAFEFTGQELLSTARTAIISAEHKRYPIDLQMTLTVRKGEAFANNFNQLINWLNLNLNNFDDRLLMAEWRMHKNGDYNPNPHRTSADKVHTTEIIARALSKINDVNS